MTLRTIRKLVATACGVLVVAVFLPASAGADPYVFTDLSFGVDGGENGVTGLFANAINNSGDIAGSAYFAGVQHGSLWRNGVYYDLGLLPGWNRNFAVALNDNGFVVGSGDPGGSFQYPPSEGVIWQVSGDPPVVQKQIAIASFGGSDGTGCNGFQCVSRATGVNNRGDVVGESQHFHNLPQSQYCWCFNPFLIPGGNRGLQYPGDALDATGTDYSVDGVNDSGTVVAQNDGNGHQNETTLFPGGGTLPFEPSQHHPINNSGWVVGYTFGSGGAILSKGGSIIDLPGLAGGTSRAFGINNVGDVVGSSTTAAGCESAVLWRHTDYQTPIDLNALTTASFHMWEAYDINDNGQIVGGGTEGPSCPTSGVLVPFLISPPTGVSGQVTDAKGNPIAGATIALTGTDPQGAVNTTATTAADGSYSIKVQAGTYDLDTTVTTPPNSKQPKGGRWVTKSCPGTIAAGGKCHIQLSDGQAAVASFSYVLPDLQAENVEITQGIQKDSWDTPTTAQVPGLGSVPGGTYAGVPLVRDVPTVVRVYASVVNDADAQPQPGAAAVLHAYRGSSGLAGSPISATATRTLRVNFSLPLARTQASGAFSFTLPKSWTEGGPITLVAEVNPDVNGDRAIHECLGCTNNNDYALAGVGFNTTQPITIRPFQIVYTYQRLGGRGPVTMSGPDLSSLFNRARDVLPLTSGHLVVQPFAAAVLDMTKQIQFMVHFWRTSNGTPLSKPNLSDCIAIPLCRTDLEGWEWDAVRRYLHLGHTGRTYLFGFEPIADGVTWTKVGTSIIGPDPTPRPLTSTAHELLHLVGFEHASTACGGGDGDNDGDNGTADGDKDGDGQKGVPWPPDQLGYIQGIGLDRRPNSGGPGSYQIIAPGVGQPQWYDFMSYCTQGHDSVAWISTINWTKFVHDDAGPARDLPSTAQAASGPRMVVDASLEPGGHAQLLGAGGSTDPLTRSQASPFHIKVLGSSGKTLDNVGVAPQAINESSLLMLSATVPARGATTIELTEGPRVLARMHKPSPAPAVRLIVPRQSLKAAHHKLRLRWSEHGARGVVLTATIQYLASGKQGWQTVVANLTATKYAVPLSLFAHATRVHIRLVVNDGFSDASATSGLVKLPRR